MYEGTQTYAYVCYVADNSNFTFVFCIFIISFYLDKTRIKNKGEYSKDIKHKT